MKKRDYREKLSKKKLHKVRFYSNLPSRNHRPLDRSEPVRDIQFCFDPGLVLGLKSKSRKKSCTISRFVHDKIFSCTIFFVHDFLRLKWNSIHLFTENGNWWTQMVNESDVKSPKRLHLVQLLNKGNDYHPFYSIFQRNIAFQVARFSHDFNFLHDFFRARKIFWPCTKSCTIAR